MNDPPTALVGFIGTPLGEALLAGPMRAGEECFFSTLLKAELRTQDSIFRKREQPQSNFSVEPNL